MQSTTHSTDLVTLVTPEDIVIGHMDKVAAHRNPAHLHRAISVFLFRKNSQTGVVELLIQQRSSKKIVGALQWANTVCGNVWPEESYLECAKRRLMVELGISQEKITNEIALQPVVKFVYELICNEVFGEHELDQVFCTKYDGSLAPNPEEVRSVRWIPWSEVVDISADIDCAPWFLLMLRKKEVMNKITTFIEENV